MKDDNNKSEREPCMRQVREVIRHEVDSTEAVPIQWPLRDLVHGTDCTLAMLSKRHQVSTRNAPTHAALAAINIGITALRQLAADVDRNLYNAI